MTYNMDADPSKLRELADYLAVSYNDVKNATEEVSAELAKLKNYVDSDTFITTDNRIKKALVAIYDTRDSFMTMYNKINDYAEFVEAERKRLANL